MTTQFLTFVDVSKYQCDTIWKKIKDAGIDGAYVRVLNGTELDPCAQQHVERAKKNGVPIGVYGFWRPDQNAIEQGNLLSKLHRDHNAFYVPMVDVENTGGGMKPFFIRRKLRKTVDILTASIRKPPTIYTRPGFWNLNVNAKDYGNCPLWVARYVHTDRDWYKQPEHAVPVNPDDWAAYAMSHPRPTPTNGWPLWSAWQFSAEGNGCGARYGAPSIDLDLNIVRAGQYSRFIAP